MSGIDDDIPFGMDEEAETETAIVATTQEQFDYGQLDNETAEYLKATETEFIQDSISNTTKWGMKFKEVKERLSNHRNGIFRAWLVRMGLNYRTVDRIIERADFIVTNCHNKELLETLPLSLSYEISKPSAPKQLVDATLNGDITSHKQYMELKQDIDRREKEWMKHQEELHIEIQMKEREIREKEKALEAEKATNRRMDSVLREKEDQLYSKDGMIRNLMSKEPEVRVEVKEVTDPFLVKRNETLSAEVLKLNSQISAAQNELASFQALKHKKEEIEKTYQKIEELKAQQSKIFKEMEETQAVFTFISKTKKFIKEEMLHIPSLVFMREKPTNILLDDLKGVITLLENFIAATKEKFNLK